MATPFVHLNTHSYYSILDGLSAPEVYVKKAVSQGAKALGMVDKGVMHGAIEFYKACKAQKIHPVLGCQVYLAFNRLTDKRHQIDNKRTAVTLLAETNEGYQNLLEMATVASLEGYYYKPRVDFELLKKHSKGLIALSGGLSGDLPQAILNGSAERVQETLERFLSIFGRDHFFLELQDHPELPQQQVINQRLIALAKTHNLPLVLTCAPHYTESEDAQAQDIMVCIREARNLDDSTRFSMATVDHSMKDPELLAERWAHVPEAMENTLRIAERCQVTFDFDTYHIPTFPLPQGKSAEGYLRELCYKGLKLKYKIAEKDLAEDEKGGLTSTDSSVQAKIERIDYELQVITKMGFTGYFLIVWDFVKWAKDHHIVVGPGRGSAAGALVSYCLDITEVDPLKYQLLFERFLNPERISLPDIDLDFTDTRRDEVIHYVAEKYGRDRVAQICTFGTLAARAAVKDVGRTMGVPFTAMNDFAKLIPEKPGTTLSEALAKSPELTRAMDENPQLRQVMDNALKLEGAVRHVSVHACGVVIADEPLTRYTALQHPPKDENGIITQYSAKPLESLGLLKMDFLGLKNLTILETALKIIERTRGRKVNLREIPMDDKKTFALLSRGETTGVFQLESAGMKRYLKELRPNEFEDIIAMVSLYRPGPMEWIPDYIAGKHGRQKAHYPHPSLEPILKTTYGIAIYQEQILKIAQEFSSYSLGEADLLRRAIGKKIASELEAQREKFIEGAVAKGHAQALAVTIFEKIIEPFADYGFNKSHGACYAMIAYQTAYLKAHFPTEFMTALMSADYGNTERIVIEIEECAEMGIRVLPPDVNESLTNFTVAEEGRIRFGLSAIKGLGQGSVEALIAAREAEKSPFASIEDFAARVPGKLLNKKTIEALALSGALDNLGERKQLAENHERISGFAKTATDSRHMGQGGLFDALEGGQPDTHLTLNPVEPATESERLKWEKDYLGLYISSHPLAGLSPFFAHKTVPADQLGKKTVGHAIRVGGLVTSVRRITTKNGAIMAIVELEDPFGKVEVVFFPKVYEKHGEKIQEDEILLVDGTLDQRGGDRQIVAETAEATKVEALRERAKKEQLWDETLAVHRASRADMEEKEVEFAGEALDIEPSAVSELGDPSLFTGKNTHQILIPRHAEKTFFSELKTLLQQHPGPDRVELLIGEKTLLLPFTVDWQKSLQEAVAERIDKI